MRSYILFENHTQGLAAHRLLDDADIPNRITSTPRVNGLRVPCGMCLLLPDNSVAEAKAVLEENKSKHAGFLQVEDDGNPMRDQYC